MGITRRNVLAVAGAGVVAAAVDIGGRDGAGTPQLAADTTSAAPPSAVPAMTTMGQTVVLGAPGAGGYRKLIVGPGEPHVVRTDLTSVVTNVTYSLDAFAHLSDLHIVDDQSPARVEWLDRLSDNGLGALYDTASAYRPQESLSTQMVDAMCRSIRQIGRGPRTGLPLSFAIVTGDAVDNCQFNETRWYVDLLDGKPFIRPDSGYLNNDESASYRFGSDPSGALHMHDNAYWSPEPQDIADNYVAGAGFPHVPGMMAAARTGYAATGLGMRWYAAFGNHDRAVQGNLPITLTTLEDCAIDIDPKAIAIGGQKPYGSGAQLPTHAGTDDYKNLLNSLLMTPVSADPDRRLLNQQQFIAEHFETTGSPVGHGFGVSEATANPYYTIPSSPVDLMLYITLDTTARKGPNGNITVGQLSWLKSILVANSSRYIDQSGQVVTQAGVVDKLIVIFCHHTIETMDNTNAPGLGGPVLESLLLQFPNVIMMANGHTHANKVVAHPRPAGSPIAGGFWEVNSPSHIDWPIQSRIIEIGAGRGTISIFTTVVDIDAPLSHGDDIGSPKALASLARELSANDPQERIQITAPGDGTGTRRGSAADRNTQLLLPAPFALPDPIVDGSSIAATSTAVGSVQYLELLGTNDADQVFHVNLAPNDQPSSLVWKQFEGQLRSVAAATNQNGSAEAFGVNSAGQVFHRVQTSPTVWDGSPWQQFDGTLRTIAAAVNGLGWVEIFGTNQDNAVVYRSQTKPGDWSRSGWGVFDGSLSQVAAASDITGRIVLFGVNAWGAIVQRIQAKPGDWTGTRWSVIDGTLNTIAVGKGVDGYLQLFGVNEDGQLLTSKQVHGTDGWQPWIPIDGPNAWAKHNIRQLAVQQSAYGMFTLIGVDADGSVLYRTEKYLAPGTWLDWQQVPGVLRAAGLAHTRPSIAAPGDQTTAAGAAVNLRLGGGSAEPLLWSYAGLPDGLTGNADGTITGTPTATADRTYSVSVGMSDKYHLSTSTTFTWHVVVLVNQVLVPNLLGDTAAEADDELRPVGLVLGQIRTTNDPTCNHLNTVMSQSPVANSKVNPGTAVDVYIGVLPSGTSCQ